MSAAPKRNPKLSASEMLAVRARTREATSYADELAFLQLCGHYPNDPDSRSLYRAAAERWGVAKLMGKDEPAPFATEATSQVAEARTRLDRDFSTAPKMPWTSLHHAIGHGLLPEQMWTVAADSGQGKTTWIMSVVDQWLLEKHRIFGLPLEQGIDTTRIYLAALANRLPVKSVLKNEWLSLPDGAKDMMTQHLDWQQDEGQQLLHLHRHGLVKPREIPQLYRRAADFGADVFFIDHIHRIRCRSHDEYEDLCASIVEGAKQWKIPALVTAQNHRGIGPVDRVKAHLIPNVDRIQGGKVLEQESAVVLGVYRPLKDDLDDETLSGIRRGMVPVKDHLKPFTVGVAGLKARIEGEVGWSIDLQWDKGRIVDPEDERIKHIEDRYGV
jgi:hypothetical protein